MIRPRTATVALVALAISLGACAGDDESDATGATPPSAPDPSTTDASTTDVATTGVDASDQTAEATAPDTSSLSSTAAPPASAETAASTVVSPTAVVATDVTAVVDSVAPDPALSAALDQVPGWLEDPTTLPADAFSDAFLTEVSIEDVQAGLASLGGGTWTMTDIQVLGPLYATAVVTGPTGALLLDLELDGDGKIDRIFFENAGLLEPPASIDELVEQLAAGGERTGLVVADVVDGECVASTEAGADEVLPIASAFKLYVLGAVATAIADGSITWDQEVTIRPELRSPWVPLDVPDGGTMTVRDLALQMISVSDNTATDHLIDLVGRDAVEAMLGAFGHHDPAVTLPLLTTREMSVLKTDTELLDRYAAADEATRRELLASEVADAPTPGDTDVWTEPRAVFEVEWFATPNDLCRALAGLQALSAQPGLEPIGEIMSANPGVVVDPSVVTTSWFKGGSEPGVLVGAWLAQRPDGTWFVSAGGAASSTTPIDPAIIELVGSALSLDGS